MPGALHLQHPANAYQIIDITHLGYFNPVNGYYICYAERADDSAKIGMAGQSYPTETTIRAYRSQITTPVLNSKRLGRFGCPPSHHPG